MYIASVCFSFSIMYVFRCHTVLLTMLRPGQKMSTGRLASMSADLLENEFENCVTY